MTNIPDWVRKENAKFEAEAKAQDERFQQGTEDGFLISKKGPEVWQQFIQELRRNIGALKELKGQDLDGSASCYGPTGAEATCHVLVHWRNLSSPNTTQATFHYSQGAHAIRCVTSSGKQSPVALRPLSDGSGVGVLFDGRVLTATEFAEVIIRGLIEGVKKPPIYV